MHKFFDYLAPDLPVKTIGELAGYIRRFAALFSGGVPVEGHICLLYTSPSPRDFVLSRMPSSA